MQPQFGCAKKDAYRAWQHTIMGSKTLVGTDRGHPLGIPDGRLCGNVIISQSLRALQEARPFWQWQEGMPSNACQRPNHTSNAIEKDFRTRKRGAKQKTTEHNDAFLLPLAHRPCPCTTHNGLSSLQAPRGLSFCNAQRGLPLAMPNQDSPLQCPHMYVLAQCPNVLPASRN